MSDLEDRRQAAFENMVRRMREPAFRANPAALRDRTQLESERRAWEQADQVGRKPLCETESEARKRAAQVAREQDQRHDDHVRRRGGR